MTDKEKWLDRIDDDSSNILKIPNKYKNRDFYLEAVKRNGHALKYIKEQDKEFYLEAIKRNGYALKYIKEQDREFYLEAVKVNGLALEYIKEQDKELCLEAVKQDGYALIHVKEEFQTYELVNIAFNSIGKKYRKDYIDFIKNNKLKDIFKFKYGIE